MSRQVRGGGDAPLVYGVACDWCAAAVWASDEVNALAAAYDRGWTRPRVPSDQCPDCRVRLIDEHVVNAVEAAMSQFTSEE